MDSDSQQNIEEKVFFKIIIPNYNNMPYIKKCLDSILEQTFQDFKIIIVDDMSTDLSDKFCEMYARRYPDKIVYHQLEKKGYAGACRNWGIDYPILSLYTWFIDSDDWLCDKYVLHKIYDEIHNTQYDIILGQFYKLTYDSKKLIDKNVKNICVDGAWPASHIINSKINQRFIENRAKQNDVIWFNRILNQITDNTHIYKLNFPMFVYNCMNMNSCQHGDIYKKSILCESSIQKMITDYNDEIYTSQLALNFKSHELKKAKNNALRFKPIITVNELFKYSLCISISKKRYKLLSLLFYNTVNAIPNVFIGSQNKKLTRIKNCQLSHYNCVQYAKNNNWPFVCIFEDDAYPCIDIYNKLTDVLLTIPSNANCLLLGWLRDYKHKPQDFSYDYNLVNTIISGAHAYIIFKSGYDEYLTFFKNNPDKPADDFIFQELSNTYILKYPLFIQYNDPLNNTIHNHKYYQYRIDSKQPPNGFDVLENIIKTQI